MMHWYTILSYAIQQIKPGTLLHFSKRQGAKVNYMDAKLFLRHAINHILYEELKEIENDKSK